MSEAAKAMSTWLGTLAKGGLLEDPHEQAGVAVAAFVVGEARLEMLREWLVEQPPGVVEREQRAAIEVCLWMAHADRSVAKEEAALLEDIIRASRLAEPIREELRAGIERPPGLDGLDERLTHPVLRELLLALSWELALSDGRVDRFEKEFHSELARTLEIRDARADEIRRAVGDELSGR